MKQKLEKLRSAFTDSPAMWFSLICCCWAYLRITLYQIGLSGRRPTLVELTLVTMIGAAVALIGLLRDREQAWYLSIVTMVLNGAAWWLAIVQVNWAGMFSS